MCGKATFLLAAGCQYGGAGILILLGITRLMSFGILQFDKFIMNIYYILFGCLIGLSQYGVEFILRHFYFLNFAFGKAFFSFFLATFTFTWSYWLQTIVSLFFFAASICFVIIGCTGAEEPEASKGTEQGGTKKEEVKSYGTAETKPDRDKGLPAPQV